MYQDSVKIVPSLTKLPTEILSNIFKYLDENDIEQSALTCKDLYHFIKAADLLWKTRVINKFHDNATLFDNNGNLKEPNSAR